MSEASHSRLSPSSAHRWAWCPGSVAFCEGLPEKGPNEYRDEGTAAHALAATCLRDGSSPHQHIGEAFAGVGVTLEMAEHVQTYVDLVRQYAHLGVLMVEEAVPIDHITGEAFATGTADAIIIVDDGSEIIVVDLKYGRGVEVSAEYNLQGAMYASGALRIAELLGYAPSRVRIVIHQPRIKAAPSEWDVARRELNLCLASVKRAAADTYAPDAPLTPGAEQCRFCRAKAHCPALAQHVANTIADDFVDVSATDLSTLVPAAHERVTVSDGAYIARLLPNLDMIEDWCAAVRKRAHADLANGLPIPGYKLVQGRRGARQWRDATEAETLLKSMRLKVEEMYTLSLISPTTAEKLHKAGAIGPRQWPKVTGLIVQPEGKPTVAPEADPRPAITLQPIAEAFDDLTGADLV